MTEERVLAGQFVLHKSSVRERERVSAHMSVCIYYVCAHILLTSMVTQFVVK